MDNLEKINFIDSLEDRRKLTNEQFTLLKLFSSDTDSFVRSRCAAILVNFETEQSKQLLLKLAKDQDEFVRTEAYDSLGIFIDEDIENILFYSIRTETDELAKNYAILSWINIVKVRSKINKEHIMLLKTLIQTEHSPYCRLACFYGLYIFGNEQYLKFILEFLQHEDYHIRCAAVERLDEIIAPCNERIIKNAIKKLLVHEETVAVKARAERFLEDN